MAYRKKYAILIIIAAILAGTFAYLWIQKPKSFEIIGNVKKIEDGRIFVEGNYIVDGKPKIEESPVQFEVLVSEGTTVTRSAFVIPSQKELIIEVSETNGED